MMVMMIMMMIILTVSHKIPLLSPLPPKRGQTGTLQLNKFLLKIGQHLHKIGQHSVQNRAAFCTKSGSILLKIGQHSAQNRAASAQNRAAFCTKSGSILHKIRQHSAQNQAAFCTKYSSPVCFPTDCNFATVQHFEPTRTSQNVSLRTAVVATVA